MEPSPKQLIFNYLYTIPQKVMHKSGNCSLSTPRYSQAGFWSISSEYDSYLLSSENFTSL